MKALALTCLVALVLATAPLRGQNPQREPDFDRQLQQQADTDKTWRAASEGFMQLDKITYRTSVGDLDIPAFVFQPLKVRGAKDIPPSSGFTRTSAVICTNTTSRTSARRRHEATSSLRPSIAGASGTARRSTTRSTTAGTRSTTS